MLELKDYTDKIRKEIGELLSDRDIKKEWEKELFEHIEKGGKITESMLNELDGLQKWYINKHYTIHGVNVLA